MKRITDNGKFWQNIKPSLTDKTVKDERTTLVDGDKVITEEKDVVKKFKDHFEKILEAPKIDRPILSDLSDDPVLNAIEHFSHHASVLKIKEVRDSSDCFSFKLVTVDDICKEILALDALKTTQSDDMEIIHLVRTQNFPKTSISYPLIRTHTCAYQGVRNVSFSENFAYVLDG